MRILIIDDDQEEFDFFEMTMEEVPGVEYETAECGESAMKRLAESTFDLIILDINLGLSSGIDCLKNLKEDPKSKIIPVIMYSSSKNMKEVNACFELGATHFFVKPHTITQLALIIHTLFRIDWTNPRRVLRENFVLNNAC